jgi:hypothetical protein
MEGSHSGGTASKAVEWEYDGGWKFKWNGQDRSLECRGVLSASVPDLSEAPPILNAYFGVTSSWGNIWFGFGMFVGTSSPGTTWDYGTLLLDGGNGEGGGIMGMGGDGCDSYPQGYPDANAITGGVTNYFQLRVYDGDDLAWNQSRAATGTEDIVITPSSPCLMVGWDMVYRD